MTNNWLIVADQAAFDTMQARIDTDPLIDYPQEPDPMDSRQTRHSCGADVHPVDGRVATDFIPLYKKDPPFPEDRGNPANYVQIVDYLTAGEYAALVDYDTVAAEGFWPREFEE